MSSTRNINNDHSAARLCNRTQALIVLDSCHSIKDLLSIHSISEDVRELESTICFDSDEESEFSLSVASFASFEFAEHESEEESSCSEQEEEEVVDFHSSLISRLDPHTITQKPPNRSSTTREKGNRTEKATNTELICPSMIVMKKKEGDAADDDVNNFDFELRHSDSLKKVIGNGHRVVKSVLSENLSRPSRWSVDCPAVKDELLVARLGKARWSHHGCNEDMDTKATRKQQQQQQRLPDNDDDLSVGEEEEEGIVDDILLHSDSRHKISNRGRRMVHTSLRSPLRRKKTEAFIAARCA